MHRVRRLEIVENSTAAASALDSSARRPYTKRLSGGGPSSSPQPDIFLPPHAWQRARRPRRPRRAATRRESACVRPAGPRAASCSSPASARGASTGCATRTAATASGPAEARLGPLGGYNPAMARARKSDKSGTGKSKAFSIFAGDENHPEDGQEDLPKDEAGRRKIKRQYEELLGIRIEKLRGRILTRERINKTIERIYLRRA